MRIELKQAEQEGQFVATFSTLNVIDKDKDVTTPGAFADGAPVRISAWGHNWGALPVGKGVIRADDERAWVEGEFFTDTAHGRDTYLTVKNLGELQEWSYGYDVDEAEAGEFEGEQVRFLRGLTVHEVSPVMVGAGLQTRTDEIKQAKVGRRNSAADMEAMRQMRGMLAEMLDMMDSLMGDMAGGSEPGKANGRTNAEDREPDNAEESVQRSPRAAALRLQMLALSSP